LSDLLPPLGLDPVERIVPKLAEFHRVLHHVVKNSALAPVRGRRRLLTVHAHGQHIERGVNSGRIRERGKRHGGIHQPTGHRFQVGRRFALTLCRQQHVIAENAPQRGRIRLAWDVLAQGWRHRR
jgi:hypothetical protein